MDRNETIGGIAGGLKVASPTLQRLSDRYHHFAVPFSNLGPMKKTALITILLSSGLLLSACGTATKSAEIKITSSKKLTPLQTCEATSADLIKAVANFKAKNPHTAVTSKNLESSKYGGPFINAIPHGSNYKFAVVDFFGAKLGNVAFIVNGLYLNQPIYFTGPKMCTLINVKPSPPVKSKTKKK